MKNTLLPKSTLLPSTWLEAYARLYAKHLRDRKAELSALLAKGYRVVYEDEDSICVQPPTEPATSTGG
jgi:hypothetical protein